MLQYATTSIFGREQAMHIAHYLSPRSQNEQMECIRKTVKQEMAKRVKEAKAFSILWMKRLTCPITISVL